MNKKMNLTEYERPVHHVPLGLRRFEFGQHWNVLRWQPCSVPRRILTLCFRRRVHARDRRCQPTSRSSTPLVGAFYHQVSSQCRPQRLLLRFGRRVGSSVRWSVLPTHRTARIQEETFLTIKTKWFLSIRLHLFTDT